MTAASIANAIAAASAAGNDKREFVRKLFENLKLSEDESKDLEIGIYNSSIEYANAHRVPLSWNSSVFNEIYLSKSRSLYANLNKDSYVKNDRLIGRLIEKEFTPHDVASMSCDRLFPEAWHDIITKEMLRAKSAYESSQVSMTDQIRCGKCKKNKISYYELQTRSGDEAMTCYFSCLLCGHRWKQ